MEGVCKLEDLYLRLNMKSERFYKIIKVISTALQNVFTEFLKTFLKSHSGYLFLNKLIDVAVNHLDNKLIDPIVDVLIIKIAKKYDINRARKTIDALERAKNEMDRDAYNQHVDDLLGGL